MKVNVPAFLAVSLTVGLFACLGVLMFREVPEGSRSMVAQLIGLVGAAVGAIVGYHYGSSSGSAAKSETLARLTGTGDGTTTTNVTSTMRQVETTTEKTDDDGKNHG